MPDNVSSIIYGFALKAKELLGSRLSKVILYGSYARGDYRENSDVDVMLLVKMNDDEIKNSISEIYDLAYDIELEREVHISVVMKNEEQFEYWEDTLPFYRNVRREGIEINAG